MVGERRRLTDNSLRPENPPPLRLHVTSLLPLHHPILLRQSPSGHRPAPCQGGRRSLLHQYPGGLLRAGGLHPVLPARGSLGVADTAMVHRGGLGALRDAVGATAEGGAEDWRMEDGLSGLEKYREWEGRLMDYGDTAQWKEIRTNQGTG